MSIVSRLSIAIKAVRQLGLTQVALNALYRVGVKVGYFSVRDIGVSIFDTRKPNIELSNIDHPFPTPSREQLSDALGADGAQALLTEADEIVAGSFRQFGAEPVLIQLAPPGPLVHWTKHKTKPSTLRQAQGNAFQPSNLQSSNDPKLTWEPARFGWAFVLGRAYHLNGDERYPESFWRSFETFQAANPPNLGPNWTSGQEVGIRLMAFAWAGQMFAASTHSTPERLRHLGTAIAQHAKRIPPTLIYARSQNNNHLLTEAAALYTASLSLPQHPDAPKWQALGQKWLTWCFAHQIDRYGEYVQHSTNYHRLMLQTALWVSGLRSQGLGGALRTSHSALALATHWLLSLLDPNSGRVPNLGANDGALIFPLSICPFDDFRPVAQAAGQAFLGYSLDPGPWDEMSLWFGVSPVERPPDMPRYPSDHIYGTHSWGYLRAVQFKSRPSHADQLHFDLWWRGLNVAQDAGTYLYNAAPPWDNRLTSTLVHNTVSVDGLEQMTRAGRFLYLDWANAKGKRHFESGADFVQRISAQTDAYARLGVHHTRTVTVYEDERWLVEDELTNALAQPHTFRLHWLLPDWEIRNQEPGLRDQGLVIQLKSPYGWVVLSITFQPSNPSAGSEQALQPATTIFRASEYIYGSGPIDPTRGWASPTYAKKVPVLSLAIEVKSHEDIKLTSEFKFPAIN